MTQFKRVPFLVLLLVLFETVGEGSAYHPERIIVKAADLSCISDEIESELPGASISLLVDGRSIMGSLLEGRLVVVEVGGTGMDPVEAAGKISGAGCVLYAEPDYVGQGGGERFVPDDPLYDRQWYMDSSGDRDIDAPEGWAITTGEEIRVAVLDSGIDTSNPSLVVFIDGGYDFVNDDSDPDDEVGHGSASAAIIAGRGNDGRDMAGVAWNAKILAVKVLDRNNQGYYSWWIRGLEWAVEHGAAIVNMSLGGTDRSSALEDAVAAAARSGVVVVAAMMNADSNIVYYPAGCGACVAVGSTDRTGARVTMQEGGTWGSSYGGHIDLVAPGLGILTAGESGSFISWSGTSMSAAMVSGAAALLLSVRGDILPAEVEAVLRAAATDGQGGPSEDTAGWDPYYGAGRLDIDDALRLQDMDGVLPDAGDEESGVLVEGGGCGCAVVR